jgi:hypothetical protein
MSFHDSIKSPQILQTGLFEAVAKVGKVPTFRASDTDADLPIVSTDLFSEFQYLKNRLIASK